MLIAVWLKRVPRSTSSNKETHSLCVTFVLQINPAQYSAMKEAEKHFIYILFIFKEQRMSYYIVVFNYLNGWAMTICSNFLTTLVNQGLCFRCNMAALSVLR